MIFRRTIVAAFVLVASMLGPAVRADDREKIKIGEFIPAAAPQPAPEISVADLAGNSVSLADFKGKFVILNLWATWCEPCLKEMPSLAALQARLGPALTVLAVSEDRGGAGVVQPFVDRLGLDKFLKIYLDPKSTAIHAFGARGLPTSFAIDADGRVLGTVEGGADWDADAMRATLAGLMPPPGDAAKPR
jgi:thiol-disulfide isomerase/thioredoxin